ncbi:MAG: RnfABCDGE type electron transport complex subunit D [Bacilli bacterium]|nr:RnfABCDGE type electron transport complex subunit D [Bacilli bacterium]
MKRFLISKTPFVRSVDAGSMSTTRMMYDVIVALFPITLFGFVINGLIPFINGEIQSAYYLLKPFLNVIIGVLFSIIFEALYLVIFKKVRGWKNTLSEVHYSFGFVTGALISLLLPVRIPLYVIIAGCFIGNILFKMLFGGFSKNIFNPALMAYILCYIIFYKIISQSLSEQITILSNTLNITANSTPLAAMFKLTEYVNYSKVTSSNLIGQFGSLVNLFIGFKGGSLGDVSGLLCLFAYIYLVVRKTINWRVPVFYIGTVFIICWAVAIANGIEGDLFGIWFPLYNIFSGSLLFCAVFVATEPVTTPRTPNGKIIFAVILGIITTLIRLSTGYDGVGLSILLCCLITPFIDKFACVNRGPIISSKMVISYSILTIILLALASFVVYLTTNMGLLFNIF